MTLKEIQELVEARSAKSPTGIRSDFTDMGALTEKVGELARVLASKHSDPSMSAQAAHAALSAEMCNVLWALCSLSNHAGIDLTEALIDNFHKR
ncbi:pyrophosphatase [Bacteroidia bacterium]|nr:pyrophosphatase [Bacteroidia bacterium]